MVFHPVRLYRNLKVGRIGGVEKVQAFYWTKAIWIVAHSASASRARAGAVSANPVLVLPAPAIPATQGSTLKTESGSSPVRVRHFPRRTCPSDPRPAGPAAISTIPCCAMCGSCLSTPEAVPWLSWRDDHCLSPFNAFEPVFVYGPQPRIRLVGNDPGV